MEEEGMTNDDLRSKLYDSFKQRGLVDAIKLQLRNRLVSELRHIGTEQISSGQLSPREDSSLLLRAANSLVADHLKSCHYDYSLSVFLPETASSEDKLLTTRDVLQLLHISSQSSLYHSLVDRSSGSDDRGFLWQLLYEVAARCGGCSNTVGVQTDAVRMPLSSSLEEEMKKVEDHFSSMSADWSTRGSAVEERLLAYQRQIDERSRAEVQLEVARFKENELARMRMEEREKSRKDIDKLRREFDANYKVKVDALNERERHLVQQHRSQQQLTEKELYSQRQSLLEEIETVRQRETNLRRVHEVDHREKQLWEDKMKTQEESAKRLQESARQKEVFYDQKLRDESAKIKLEQQAAYLERMTSVESREAKVKEDERRLYTELKDITLVKDELREKRQQVNELEAELTRARHKLISAESQAQVLSERSREMMDYQILKEENSVLKAEVSNLKMRINDLGKENLVERQKHESLLREMTDMASKPSPENYLLQKELDKMRTQLKNDHAIFDHQRQHAERRLNDEMDRNQELMRKFEEQTLQMREMNGELTDVRHQLLHTHTALDNEVYRRPRPQANLTQSGSHCDLEELAGNDLFPTRSLPPPRSRDPTPSTTPRGSHAVDSDDFSYSGSLVEDTKRRLRHLEAEAENLEQNYKTFQMRMINVTPPLTTPSIHQAPPSRPHSILTEQSKPQKRPTPNTSSRSTVSRPLSSTPSRVKTRHMTVPTRDQEGSFLSVSSVRSASPDILINRDEASTRPRPLSVSDLDPRSASPEIPGHTDQAQSVFSQEPAGHTTPPPSSYIHPPAPNNPPVISLDSAWNKPPAPSLDAAWNQPPVPSLDSAWKAPQSDEDRARERGFEEGRRVRDEERRRQTEAAWEREQKQLEALEHGQSGEDPAASEQVKPAAAAPGDIQIDDTMKRYMEMVQKKREEEKAQKEKTASHHSEGDVDTAEKSDAGIEFEDDDFEW